MKQRGQPSAQRDDVPLVAFEKTTALVTTGAYRYIRHPLYSSLLFLARRPAGHDGDLVSNSNRTGRRGGE